MVYLVPTSGERRHRRHRRQHWLPQTPLLKPAPTWQTVQKRPLVYQHNHAAIEGIDDIDGSAGSPRRPCLSPPQLADRAKTPVGLPGVITMRQSTASTTSTAALIPQPHLCATSNLRLCALMILKAFRVVYNEKYSGVSELGRIANRTACPHSQSHRRHRRQHWPSAPLVCNFEFTVMRTYDLKGVSSSL